MNQQYDETPSNFAFNFNLRRYTEGGATGDAARTPTTKTVRTELRDMFVKRRHHAVVFVPCFEYDKLEGRGLHSSTFQLNLSQFLTQTKP